MHIELKIDSSIVGALLHFAAKKDVRYYLNGICLEIGTDESRAVATDGTILGCFRIDQKTDGVTRPVSVIIPSELLNHIKPRRGEYITISIGDVVTSPHGRDVSITFNNSTVTGVSIDGVFPDWRRIIPNSTSGEAAQFNLNLFTPILKSYSTLHGKTSLPLIRIEHNGSDTTMFSMNDLNFIGVVMPLRKSAVEPLWSTIPKWVRAEV